MAERGTPAPSSEAARRRMENQARRDTRPEMALRRALHAMGLRYRVDRPPLAGLRRRADLVFPRARVAIYIDGCFWHSCPEHGTSPKNNGAWWNAKLEANRARDADTDRRLNEAGWVGIRIWEHEDPLAAARRVAQTVIRRTGGALAAEGRRARASKESLPPE